MRLEDHVAEMEARLGEY